MMIILIVLLFFSAGCEPRVVKRQYVEIVKPFGKANDPFPGHPPINPVDEKPPEQSLLTWITPEGWSEEKGIGFRLVTFRSNDQTAIECTIVSLGQEASSLKANIVRWLGQLSITDVSDSQVQSLIDNAVKISTADNQKLLVFNFNSLLSDQNKPSMLAGILTTPSKTIFVKMTGTVKSITEETERFHKLCESLRLINE